MRACNIKVSKKRKDAVKAQSLKKTYRKHHNGIKFTRVYFKDGSRIKIDDKGNIKKPAIIAI